MGRYRERQRDRDRRTEKHREPAAVELPGGLGHVGVLRKQYLASCASRRIKIRTPTLLRESPEDMSATALTSSIIASY